MGIRKRGGTPRQAAIGHPGPLNATYNVNPEAVGTIAYQKRFAPGDLPSVLCPVESRLLIYGQIVTCGPGCGFGARYDQQRRGITVWHEGAGGFHEMFISSMTMANVEQAAEPVQAWLRTIHELTAFQAKPPDTREIPLTSPFSPGARLPLAPVYHQDVQAWFLP